MTQTATAEKPAKQVRKMARMPNCEGKAEQQSDGAAQTIPAPVATDPAVLQTKLPTKTDIILGLLRRDQGATLADLVSATGWLPHTTRAALTGIKRKGHILSSEKAGGMRTYRVTAAETGS